ncbi:TPA: type III secretion system needle length determinant, SpaN/EivJ family [Enterobacter hormaechei]
MEPVIATTFPGRVPTSSQDEADNSLDNRARELARNKPRQRGDDKRQLDNSGALPLFPMQQLPLPPALAALRQKGHSLKHVTLSGNALTSEASTTLLRKSKVTLKAQMPATDKSDAMQPISLGSRVAASLTGTIPLMKGGMAVADSAPRTQKQVNLPVASATEPAASRVKTHEKRACDEGTVSILPVSQPVPFSSLRQRIEAQVAMSSYSPVTVSIADTPRMQPSGLTYRFTRWGAEHTVTIQGQTGGALLLQPSDPLVTQQLSAQWQSGDPQKWQLARDGSEGREQRHQQQNEEDEA